MTPISKPDATFAGPIGDRWFEDYRVGDCHEFGTAEMTEERILAFAREFDPQSFHVDPEAAATGPFGGLIASGWHTCAVLMRLFADHYLSTVASLGGPGVDELRWTAPVRPGDHLRVRATVAQARVSRSKPDRGLVHTAIEMINQDDQVVLTATVLNLLRLRPATGVS
jgi:acyl dehydratase